MGGAIESINLKASGSLLLEAVACVVQAQTNGNARVKIFSVDVAGAVVEVISAQVRCGSMLRCFARDQ